MLATMQAVYIGRKHGSFTVDENKEINYTTISLGNPDPENSDQVIRCSVDKSVDVDKLVRYKDYLFVIDIPLILKDNQKVKVVEVLEFGKDKSKDVK